MSQIPIFVINLNRATERLAKFAERCAELGLAVERIPAVDGTLLTATEKRVLNPRRLIGGEMSDGEIACYESHLRALRIIVERGLPRACIMEDDVNISESALVWLAPDAPLPADCGILKLEGILRPKTKALPILEYAGHWMVFPSQVSFGAAAYIITLEAARHALQRLKGMGKPIDHALFHYWEHGSPVYEVHPFPVWQENREESFLQEGRRELLKFRKPKTPVRRLQKRLKHTVASVRISVYQFRRYGFRMFDRVPVRAAVPGPELARTAERGGAAQ